MNIAIVPYQIYIKTISVIIWVYTYVYIYIQVYVYVCVYIYTHVHICYGLLLEPHLLLAEVSLIFSSFQDVCFHDPPNAEATDNKQSPDAGKRRSRVGTLLPAPAGVWLPAWPVDAGLVRLR